MDRGQPARDQDAQVPILEQRPVDTTLYSLADAPPPPPERRDGERHLTLYRVGSLTIDGRRELCLIKNVSAGGMMIRAYCAIPAGTKVGVELKHGSAVAGIACWADGHHVGISFDQPIDVVELLAFSMEGPRPRMPRVEVAGPVSLRQDGTIHRARLRDISQGGVKLESATALSVDGDVVVTIAGMPPQAGAIRWREGACYGISLNRVIPLPTLVDWLRAQREQLRAAS